VAFESAFDKGLEIKNRKNDIFSVIQDLTQRQKKANILTKYILKVHFGGVNVENLLSFLGLFQQIPNTINVLKLELFSKNLKILTEIIQKWKPSRKIRCEWSMIFLKKFYEKVKKFVPRTEKVKNYVIQLQENHSFMEFAIPQLNEIDELQRLLIKAGKKICEDFSVNGDFYFH